MSTETLETPETTFEYPEVHVGDPIEFAPSKDVPAAMWNLARIIRSKNGSVDIELEPGRRARNVWHVGDPRLNTTACRDCGGVFRLTNAQIRLNQMFAEHDAMKRRMDALEQTFRAVMDSQGAEGVPSPAGRRGGRKAVAEVETAGMGE